MQKTASDQGKGRLKHTFHWHLHLNLQETSEPLSDKMPSCAGDQRDRKTAGFLTGKSSSSDYRSFHEFYLHDDDKIKSIYLIPVSSFLV
jgi:hypothetical protein